MNTNDDTLKFVELLTTAVSTAESLTPSVGHVRIALPLSLSPQEFGEITRYLKQTIHMLVLESYKTVELLS
jgi:hypothetical protein